MLTHFEFENLKSIFKKAILFIIILLLLYPVIIFIYGHIPYQTLKPNLIFPLGSYGHMHTRLREIKNYKNIDILFIGSSYCYRSFDTRVYEKTGYKSFNLGSSGQSPIITETLINKYLDVLKPKIIIYAVSPSYFYSDGIESSLDIIANDNDVDCQIFKMASRINNLKVYNALLYAYIRHLLNFDIDYNEPIYKDRDTYINGGFVERELSFIKLNEPVKDYVKTSFKKKQLIAFKNIIQKFNNNNISYILVRTPVTRRLNMKLYDDNYFAIRMQNYGKYIDFNQILELNDSLDFYDDHHLNSNGVKKINLSLIKIIKNLK